MAKRRSWSTLKVCWIDYAQFFDSLGLDMVVGRLLATDLQSRVKLARILKVMASRCWVQLRLGEDKTEKLVVQERIQQGSSWGPLLAVLCLGGGVSKELTAIAVGLTNNEKLRIGKDLVDLIQLLYADDILLLARFVRTLEKLLVVVKKNAAEDGISVADHKCVWMAMIIDARKGKSSEIKADYLLGGTIGRTEQEKYFGIMIESRRTEEFKVHREMMMRKLSVAIQ